jgi:division/cell wall cluster transcriptional repressor MraZ
MFAGEYLCKVDEKGRFIVPSPIREQIEADGQTVMFLKGPEQSLLIYSTKEWEKVLERTRTSLDEDQSRLFMHFVVSEAGSSDIDKTGRILIPGRLRNWFLSMRIKKSYSSACITAWKFGTQVNGVGILRVLKIALNRIWQRS